MRGRGKERKGEKGLMVKEGKTRQNMRGRWKDKRGRGEEEEGRGGREEGERGKEERVVRRA